MSTLSTSSINDLRDDQFAYIEPGGKKDDQGKTVPRSLRHFPIHDAAHVRNALARAPQSPFGDKAMPKIRAAAKKFGIKVTENRADAEVSSAVDETPRAPIEFRESNVADVNRAQRRIEVIAVPYDEEALVEYRGEMWRESFDPGAFIGIETRPDASKVRANREHDPRRTIGKVVNWWPSRKEGLVAEVRVSKTLLGDETLALAEDDVLGASIGFAARGRDQMFERRTMKRRILRAFADHLAFTTTPAYAGAEVLNVREGIELPTAANLPRLVTPALDELMAWQRARIAGREG